MDQDFNKNVFSHDGYCPICERKTTFTAEHPWLRDHFFCLSCGSIPRERALFKVISDYYPNWRDLKIHESSPGGRGASIKLHNECKGYTSSQYYPGIKPGFMNPASGYRCENLENLTFPACSFDLFISQDVMEHIFDIESAFKEIARVLKSGGAHIFTAPLVNKTKNSEVWASRNKNGQVINHHDPEYHGNPIDDKGSLVTMHFGYDLAGFIVEKAKTPTVIIAIDNIDLGIRAEYIDVLISVKMGSTSSESM